MIFGRLLAEPSAARFWWSPTNSFSNKDWAFNDTTTELEAANGGRRNNQSATP
jgi:hypothetical protein